MVNEGVHFSLEVSEDGLIYGTIKVTKRNKKLILHKHVPMAKVPIL